MATEKLIHSLPWEKRQELLVRGWMAHDARWFAAVAGAIGVSRTNPLNQQAARGVGRAEMRSLMEALGLPKPRDLASYLRLQETGISLYGPDLLDYSVQVLDPASFRLIIRRCFAHEQVAKAGIGEEYECGILARLQGWLDAAGLEHELVPLLGKCFKVRGRECSYQIRLRS